MVALPKISIDTDLQKNLCFGCGPDNPVGLKLSFTMDGNTLRTECTPDSVYQGWPGLVHGGILSLILDEAMNNVAFLQGITCVTASMNIRLRQPVKVEEPLVITAKITKHNRKLIESKAKICLKDGTVVAESTSKQFVVEESSRDGGK